MALNIEDKKAIVAGVSEVAKKALSAVVADSCGIEVAQMTKLRKEARDNNVYLHVVRNTLLARAVEGTEFECMKDSFKGPTLIGFSLDHPGAAARLFKDFAKTNANFEVKALAFEGKFYEGKDIDVLASLPTFDEGVAQLMATMKEAAAGKLVRTLAALEKKLNEGGEAA
ncbi:50S ribosomal protein L8 [Anaerobiospirillum thomasii]|uniref:Large ribosomal subunit protein uL10 n=1 Tax=Anaerobiospirillum thomasii TaxID=179995 RepID=A0A2X0V9X9_9GAMM|nr:50S ribosomal protein L10 [Anaerobiospirillum thomasii]SPT68948.1 50S ribosomal protein L8 [Anaerobiospirillum thomasii]SPT71189.1 50S ribosomal protein L8 [Anaerobiospirillum thomasii]